MNNIEIIISRFNENLNWTLESPFNKFQYIVYNKGNNENFNKSNVKQIINIQNVGRECHTYLYHIIENYDKYANSNKSLQYNLRKSDGHRGLVFHKYWAEKFYENRQK